MRKHLDPLLSRMRFGQFISVGVIGAVLDIAVTTLLATNTGLYRGSAKLVGAELAIVVMFLVNEHWTFASAGSAGIPALLRRFLKSNLVRAAGVLVATGVFIVVSGVEHTLPVSERLWLIAANAVGIGVGFVVNYTAETLFTWRLHDD